MASSTSGTGVGSPCGACKFLRRRCTQECVFAPYFDSEQSPAQFAAIHKVFGASNVSKLLAQLPVHLRCDAVVTVAYEAQARIRDPVYGCVAHIFALQKQVSMLQAQLMQVKAQLAYQASSSTLPPAANGGSDGDRLLMQQVMGCKEEPHHHFGELHAMAQRLMRS
ncbi:LOB domain-containing protein 16-like isoform X2 [Zingiber officinale]|uniref:LOB domain-containing protein 16-like isoform X2 n=1 Tax=Zingiber officinale TaxID=94328 RepID=UPI001C4CBBBE|nr:LOB domain-containing protein 16-like isoform X2 [Zingiber officinale]XP_042445341.1 LOB domain-containing protein 16-like isoform X2 [Zingiber officinale]